jgi:hypothetical protein
LVLALSYGHRCHTGSSARLLPTLETSRSALLEHAGASADLESVADDVLEQVRLLDALVRYRFGDNAELIGAWASAHNVLGPFKPKVEPETGTDATPQEVKPAA